MTEQHSDKIRELVNKATHKQLANLLELGLSSSNPKDISQVTREEIAMLIKGLKTDLPRAITEPLDIIFSKITNPQNTSWASYYEARRNVIQYLEVIDGALLQESSQTSSDARAVQFSELLNAWERQYEEKR